MYVCLRPNHSRTDWRTFFSSKLHLKWLLCIFVLPNAMPCWDDCCVDESPQTDLSGKQMADDRREFKRGTFGTWFFLGVAPLRRSIWEIKNLHLAIPKVAFNIDFLSSYSKVRSIPSFVLFVLANLGVHTIEQNLRKSSWNTPSTNGDNGSSGSFSLLKKSRNVFTFVCHFRRTSRTIASFSIPQTSFICWAALPRSAFLRWNMPWFWYNRIIPGFFRQNLQQFPAGWDVSGIYWTAFLASSSSIFWRENSPLKCHVFFLKKISPKDAK